MVTPGKRMYRLIYRFSHRHFAFLELQDGVSQTLDLEFSLFFPTPPLLTPAALHL